MHRYTGSLLPSGVRHGQGTYIYQNPTFKYTGEWDNGIKSGKGKFSIGSDGPVYEGEFKDGEMTGVGTKRWPDGSSFTGHFVEGEMDGEGLYLNASTGEKYEGSFKGNRRHGTGKVTFSNGDTYEGDFANNRAHGQGTLHCANGDQYQGSWESSERSGTGTAKWANGDEYHGEWWGDQRHGKGEFQDGASGLRYSGYWVHDHPSMAPSQAIACKPEFLELAKERRQTDTETNGFTPSSETTAKDAPESVPTLSKIGTVSPNSILEPIGLVVQHVEEVEVILSEEERLKLLQESRTKKGGKGSKKAEVDLDEIPTSQVVTSVTTMHPESNRMFRCRVLQSKQNADGDIETIQIPFCVLKDDEDTTTLFKDEAATEHSIQTTFGVACLGRWGIPSDADAPVTGPLQLVFDDCTAGLEDEEMLESVKLELQVGK